MNFRDDDPLGDILSDGSNDSFFDDPKATAKRNSLTKTAEKKSITDLFNISDGTRVSKELPKKADDWLGLDSKEPTLDTKKSPIRTPKSTKKISFDDDDDILGTMGLSKRPQSRNETPMEEKSKKIDLFESILGPSTKPEEKTKPSFDDILKESKARSDVKPPSDFETPKVAREGRRGRRPSTGLMDPLGLFSAEAKTATKLDDSDIFTEKRSSVTPSKELESSKPSHSQSTPNITEKGALPDWLGGSGIKTSKSENILSQKSELKEAEAEPPNQEVDKTTALKTDDENQLLTSMLTQQKLAHSHMEYQNTAIALQQQESQLLMALQLKKYEENLAELQHKQQEVLMKQEQQFNTLLERQFAKQHIMENNMRLQQERINNHIQMLISQPPITRHADQEELEELKKSTSEESVKLYENMVNSLKQRQHEEIFLLEESYKKQISLLEESLDSVEKRLRSDIGKLTDMFEEKLKTTSKDHEDEIGKYKQKLQEMEERHIDEIKQIRENHTRVIDEIKYEHSTLLENIKQSKQSETSLFSESNTFIQKLDTNIDILFSNSKNLQQIKDNIEQDYGILTKAREESLKAKEHEITMMRATLEKCRQSAESERAELMGLVRSLETKIAEQNQSAREERWAFQQAASTLAARSAALDREVEFNRATIERERDQLKTLKESMLAEQEKMILELTEEKLKISAEKSRLETSSKLSLNYDSQRARAETEAAVQIAKEATEMADREREKLQREKFEIEKLKRTLLDQERKLSVRESELDNITREAERKIADGERAIVEAKTMENQYNERLRDLQNQLVILSNREKKLAEEKIALSKERLVLNTMARQTKKCGLCAVDAPRLDDHELNSNQYFSRFQDIDSDIIRLRLEATDEDFIHTEDNVPM